MARDIDRQGEFVWREIRGGLNRANGGAWVETPIPDAPGWYAACLLLRIGDGVTLTELRILPDAGRWLPPKPPVAPPTIDPGEKGPWATAVLIGRRGSGEWTRRPKDLKAEHAGGITSRMLRKVPLDAIVDEALRRQNEYSRLPKGWDAIARNAPGRPGRAGRDDRWYAIWAKRYADRAAKSKSPIRDLAEIYGEHYGAVAQWIYDARDRGLLSRAGDTQQGRRGGTLTPKALAILRKGK
jgi:hypothetical protein